jgi:D-3-phosphoglycerate dehydrogenase
MSAHARGGPPKVAVFPPLPSVEAAARAGGAETTHDPTEADAIVWTDPSDPDGLRALLRTSRARWVQLPFAGIESFFAAGVIDDAHTWTCMKGAYGPATAEGALALMLAAARQIHRHARARTWLPRAQTATHRRLEGAAVLVVGTGGIGRALASYLGPLGARVLAANRSGEPMPGAERTARVADIAELVPLADWIVLAAPSTPETHHLVDEAFIARMKPGAWIVNVARGDLVDTLALVEALRAKRIGGAALDVTDPEPLPDDHPLWDFDDVIVSSHTANTKEMAVPELAALVARNVRKFANGEPLEGLVDPDAGY